LSYDIAAVTRFDDIGRYTDVELKSDSFDPKASPEAALECPEPPHKFYVRQDYPDAICMTPHQD